MLLAFYLHCFSIYIRSRFFVISDESIFSAKDLLFYLIALSSAVSYLFICL